MTDGAELDQLTAQYRAHGRALRAAVTGDGAEWLERLVSLRAPTTYTGDQHRSVIASIVDDIDRRLAALVEADVDEPVSGPLEILRSAVSPLGDWLASVEAPVPRRDPRDVELHPTDHYDLGPMRFDDVSPGVHEAGIAWGAAKAFLHRARHRHEPGAGGVD